MTAFETSVDALTAAYLDMADALWALKNIPASRRNHVDDMAVLRSRLEMMSEELGRAEAAY